MVDLCSGGCSSDQLPSGIQRFIDFSLGQKKANEPEGFIGFRWSGQQMMFIKILVNIKGCQVSKTLITKLKRTIQKYRLFKFEYYVDEAPYYFKPLFYTTQL